MINNDIWIKKLKHWANENPIKNINTLQNDFYQDFDGYLGLPSDEKDYASVEKLILPLWDTYTKCISKELGNLLSLNEFLKLIII